MQNRITIRFSELSSKSERALICYVVAGYPDVETTLEVIESLVAGGVDIIEIGVPFSDPIADGPTIQAASNSALEKGITPEKALHMAKIVRKRHPNLPLIAMTYCNIFVRAGIEKLMVLAREHGIDGIILPDLSIEESKEYMEAASKLGISLLFFASPNTSEKRIKEIARITSGFLYLVSVYGITGTRTSFENYTLKAVKNAKRLAGKVPVAVGFGISTPAHAKFMIAAGADALVVGSAIVERIARNNKKKKKMLNELHEFVKSMKKACKK